jgi:hypothetical protein
MSNIWATIGATIGPASKALQDFSALAKRERGKGIVMTTVASPFRSLEGEAEYMAAYEARMRRWPVPYESI